MKQKESMQMAKRKLTEVQTVYIDNKRGQLNAAELSKILGFTEKAIQEYMDANPIESIQKEASQTASEIQKEEPQGIVPQFITKTGNGKSGVAICTPQASEVGDFVRQNRKSKPNSKFNDCTTKVKK